MITVSNTNDSGAGSLRQAIADAIASEEITFAVTGTITLTSAELLIAQAVTITGPGSAQLTISGDDAFRIFNLTAGVISISGLTLTKGAGVDGGALHNETTLTLSDIVITASNTTGNGGGIHNTSTITAVDLTISTCGTDADGGGIWSSGTFTAVRLSVSSCSSAINGAGIHNTGTFVHSFGTVGTNTATSIGGGIYNEGTYNISDATVSANVSVGNGAGIQNTSGTVEMARCTVSGNNPIGVFNTIAATLTIDNSTISGNTGFGISNDQGSVLVTHSTITQNAYGFNNTSGSASTIQNTILAGNTAAAPADWDSDTADFTSNGNNLFGFGTNPITPAGGDSFGLTFAALIIGPLQDNGGPTFTHALLTASPAIDSGNTAAAPATDQRGEPRVFNGTIDIGAYEKGCSPELTFTGTLPGWLTIQGQCLIVTPNVFRAATKEQANALAQAALDQFIADAIANDELSCDCPEPPSCIPPNFARQEYTGTLSSGSDVSNLRTGGGDHYCLNVPVDMVAGQSVAFFWQGDFDCYAYLVDPSNSVVRQDDDSGVITPGRFRNSAITYTALVTGAYTFQGTTFGALSTGDYKLIISDGVEKTIGGMQDAWIMIYVASTKRIFVIRKLEQFPHLPTHPTVSVIDSLTDIVLADTELMGDDVPAEPLLFYNPVDDSVWCGSATLDPAQGKFHRLDPSTGALLESFNVPGGGSVPIFFGAYCPTQNKIFGRSSTVNTELNVFNCGTRLFEANISLPLATSSIQLIYVSELDRVLVVDNQHIRYYLVNPNDSSIQTFLLGVQRFGFFLDGKWYTSRRDSPWDVISVDLLTGTVIDSFPYGYASNGPAYNPCRNCMMLPPEIFSDFNAYSAVSMDFSGTITEQVIANSTSSGFNNAWLAFLWNPDTQRMYFNLSGSGNIYVLS